MRKNRPVGLRRITGRGGARNGVALLFTLFCTGTILCMAGCALREPGIADLVDYPQHTGAYLSEDAREPLASDAFRNASAERYRERYFAPWNDGGMEPPCRDVFSRPVESARNNPGFGENRRPHAPHWIESVIAETAPETFPSRSIPAITIAETNVRSLPTNRPRYLPRRGDCGYPFDYWQESLLFANTPLRILHATPTGDWYFVQAPFVSGWVLSRDVATMCADALRDYREGPFVVPLEDHVPFRDGEGRFLFRARIGGLYPASEGATGTYAIRAVIADRGNDGAAFVTAAAPMAHFAPFPRPLTSTLIAATADAMADSPYGWGGLYGNRDCSAFLRDLFSGFGLWLPRNSFQQVRAEGGFIDLEHLTPDGRERRIIDEGIPFGTILWMPGHVLLYIGTREERALAVHVLWGLRNRTISGGEGRIIVGGLAVTTLAPGKERCDVPNETLLIHRIAGMRHLVPPPGRADGGVIRQPAVGKKPAPPGTIVPEGAGRCLVSNEIAADGAQ